MEREGRLSGKRYNRIRDALVERYIHWRDFFVESLMEDGYPPFHDPISPREQYDKLVAWRAAGDPRFWHNPGAAEALSVLSLEFGPPPPLQPPQPGGPLPPVRLS